MRPTTNALAGLATAIVVLALAVALNFAFWWVQGRPQDLPDAKTPNIKSASFSPYRPGQSPFGECFTRAQLEEDMAVAAKYFTRIRTYSNTGQFAPVPELAQKNGLKVILGAWIGANLQDNEDEIAGAIKAANAYPDTVERVVVGNEVLLRSEVTPELLIKYIRRVKAAIKQPVTYADVWEYWLEYPQVAREVDSITIHVLPYWENTPTPLEHTIEHMLEARAKITRAFPGKPVLIGEIGWPSAGRVRKDAVPGRVAQARFVRQIINTAVERGIDFNIFELFDEPWKANQEGTVGANWGLIDSNRHLKFPLTGPVSEKPYWFSAFLASSGLAGLLAALALFLRPPRGFGKTALICLAAQFLSTLLAASAEQSLHLAFGLGGLASGLLLTGGGALLCLLVFSELADLAAGHGENPGPRPLAPVIARLESLRSRRLDLTSRAGLVGLLDLMFGLAALSQTVGLIVDPRYRDFRVAQFLPVALCLALRLFATRELPRPVGSPREEWLFVCSFVAGAVIIPLVEGLKNPAALAWGGTLLLLAVPWGLAILRQRQAKAKAI
ncbi:MAG: glycosyl hydrolase family 17 protein [Humidesulfovibrio sp.]|nr:glycosyl hydrolase family 17 protein [Humidesulfovibrio sp.]